MHRLIANGPVRADARVTDTRKHFYVGLDLGKQEDYTAIAVVERAQLTYEQADPVSYDRLKKTECRLRYMERVRLQTPYPRITDRVRSVLQSLGGSKLGVQVEGTTLVVDATGVGGPVVDMLRAAKLNCTLSPVVITSGYRESQVDGVWHVPRQSLVSGLQVAVEHRELGISKKMRGYETLVEELLAMGSGDEHDDLVFAVALAWWKARARRAAPPVWGSGRLL
jgi:hypothetical protein